MKVLVDQRRETLTEVEIGYWVGDDRVITTVSREHQPQPVLGEMFEIEEPIAEIEAPAIAPPTAVEKEEKPKASPTAKKPEVEAK